MAGALVDRATSDMLLGSDWAMNVQICDILNRDPGQAKDVVKSLRKRIGHKNPRVQLLALTLLETVIKSCGDIVHMHVAEKDILHKMVKIVKKKPDPQVKEKILVLVDTWQEAFGGPRATYPQFYAAYHELLHAGAVFPQRHERSGPTFSQQKEPTNSHPSEQSTSFPQEVPETSVGTDLPPLSLTEIQNARGIMDVLAEMLNAIDPGNREGLKQEVIVDLVDQCRTYKQRVVQLINKSSDEELLCQGLALNDDLQNLLAKHDSIVSGIAVQVVKPKSLQALVEVDDSTPSKEPQQRSTTSTITTSQPPLQQLSLPAPPASRASANSLAIIDPKIDFLSGEDFSKSADKNQLALVPVGVGEPLSNSAADQNILALVDMFPQTKTQANNNSPTNSFNPALTLSAPQTYHSGTPLQPSSQPASYTNGNIPNPGLSHYEHAVKNRAQLNQTNSAWNSQVPSGFTPQQQGQGYGVNEQSGLQPLPPWVGQSVPSNEIPNSQPQLQQPAQFGGVNSLLGPTGQLGSMQPQLLQHSQFGGVISMPGPTGQPGNQPQNTQFTPGSFMGVTHQQLMVGTQFGGLQPPQVQNSQYVTMYAPMQNGQMAAIYSQQMLGGQLPPSSLQNQLIGYGGYMKQTETQFYNPRVPAHSYYSSNELSQSMHGLSVQDNNMLAAKTSSYQNSMPSYLPQSSKTAKPEDKLFGDLLSMAKTKQSKPAASNF